MRIGASLMLIAIGAVLKFAVTKTVSGISLTTVGVIMMIVGAVGLAITLILMTTRRRSNLVYGPNGVAYDEPVATVGPHYFGRASSLTAFEPRDRCSPRP
jgi:Domain of unknown function (DUF6458)